MTRNPVAGLSEEVPPRREDVLDFGAKIGGINSFNPFKGCLKDSLMSIVDIHSRRAFVNVERETRNFLFIKSFTSPVASSWHSTSSTSSFQNYHIRRIGFCQNVSVNKFFFLMKWTRSYFLERDRENREFNFANSSAGRLESGNFGRRVIIIITLSRRDVRYGDIVGCKPSSGERVEGNNPGLFLPQQ